MHRADACFPKLSPPCRGMVCMTPVGELLQASTAPALLYHPVADICQQYFAQEDEPIDSLLPNALHT